MKPKQSAENQPDVETSKTADLTSKQQSSIFVFIKIFLVYKFIHFEINIYLQKYLLGFYIDLIFLMPFSDKED